MNARRAARTFAVSLSLSLAMVASQVGAQAAKPADPPAAAPAAPAAPAAAPASADAMSGIAAVYGTRFAGRKTASGARYNPNALTAAHNTLPFGTRVKVTGVKSKRSAIVVINDRGPTTAGRIIDLSSAAARKIGMSRPGLRQVTLEVLSQPAAKTRKAAKK